MSIVFITSTMPTGPLAGGSKRMGQAVTTRFLV